MAFLDEDNGKDRRSLRGPVPAYARMPRGGRVIIDPERLRYWRNARGLTRAALAQGARISVYSVDSYETGRAHPYEKTYRRLCTALGIDFQDLLFDDCRYYVRKQNKEGR